MKTKLNIQHSKFPLNTLYSVFFILILYSAFFILYSNKAYAATEFVSTVKQSGGDYSTLASWEAAIQSNLAASTTAVYSGTGTGSLSQGNIVELFRGGTYQNATSTVVATTSSQILVQNYYNSGAPITLQSGDEWRKASSTANMFTVSGSGTQLGDTPIAIAQIDGAWTSADTTAVAIDGWTTDATHYIRIYTTVAARHSGKWDTGKYRLEFTNNNGIRIYENYVRIDGVQIFLTNSSYDGIGIEVLSSILQDVAAEIRISNNIVRASLSSTAVSKGIHVYDANTAQKVFKIWNNIVYDFKNINNNSGQGIYTGGASIAISYVYNNTVYNNYFGYVQQYSGVTVLKNNIANGNTTDYSGTFNAASSNNISQDATSPNAALRSKTVSFVDSTNKDFHLSSSDISAKDAGTNLSADPNLAFSDDIDGNTRPIGSAWDIGTDETYGVIIIIE